jgi:hypothetical protein
MEFLLLAFICASVFLYLENRKVKSYLAAVEGRLLRLDKKELQEDGALESFAAMLNAHDVMLKALLENDLRASSKLLALAMTYPSANASDEEMIQKIRNVIERKSRQEQ